MGREKIIEGYIRENYPEATMIDGPIQWGLCSSEDLEGCEYEVWTYTPAGGGDNETVAMVNDPDTGWREADGGEIGKGWDY